MPEAKSLWHFVLGFVIIYLQNRSTFIMEEIIWIELKKSEK